MRVGGCRVHRRSKLRECLNKVDSKNNAPDLIATGVRRLTPGQLTAVYAECLRAVSRLSLVRLVTFPGRTRFVSWFVS
jgi:hypothetical protein